MAVTSQHCLKRGSSAPAIENRCVWAVSTKETGNLCPVSSPCCSRALLHTQAHASSSLKSLLYRHSSYSHLQVGAETRAPIPPYPGGQYLQSVGVRPCPLSLISTYSSTEGHREDLKCSEPAVKRKTSAPIP